MSSTEIKTIDIHLCHKCNNEIPFGKPYYSIVRSLEFRFFNEEEKEEEIEIIETEEIISLCKICGSYFNMEGLDTILRNLPLPGQENRN